MENNPTPNTPEQRAASPGKTLWNIFRPALWIALGILLGVLVAQKAGDYLPVALPVFMAVFISVFVVLLVAILALPRIFNYLAKRYSGQDVDMETFIDQVQDKVNHIADAVTASALVNASPEVRKNIRNDLPHVINYLLFSQLRSVGLRFLLTVFAAIGGLMGTILLFNQNQLLTAQNKKIDNQILLEEASRRSSLNFLMANILDKIDEELKSPDNTKRRLSPQLIGRIAALSQSFQPYRFMDGDTLTAEPYSPERGILLLALVNSNLDTLTLDTIYAKSIFNRAYLKTAILHTQYLKNARLHGVQLNGSYLMKANLRGANLSGANLSGAYLSGACLSGADFSETNLSGAYLIETDLSRAYFSKANFSGADLFGAELFDVNDLSSDQLKTTYSLYNVKGIPEDTLSILKKEEPRLFENPFKKFIDK